MQAIRWSRLPASMVGRVSGGGRRSGPRAQPEYDQQVRLFALIELMARKNPGRAGDLEDVWATGNGGKRPAGAAGRMREAGQRKGVPDVLCLVPSATAHGLAIEMKSATGRLTPEQAARLSRLAARGYRTHEARSWQEAGGILCDHLGIPWPANAEAMVEWILAERKAERKASRRARKRGRNTGATVIRQAETGRVSNVLR